MPSLYDEYPFLMKYFRSGITEKSPNISHCILLYGSDVNAQYKIALEIARILNCKEGGSPDCQCLNCKWISENKHPAVITVSKDDFKSEDDTTKTAISIKQAHKIRSMLMMSSDYHRVIIFCDKDEEGNMQGINSKVFQDVAANALLKTFEEPPQNTTFIILTKNKTDVISTIISRCQCFYVPTKNSENITSVPTDDLVSLYISQDKNKIFDFQNKLTELLKEYPANTVLNSFENGLYNILKENINNKILCSKIREDLKSTETAKNQSLLAMSDQVVAENLTYKIFNIN